MFCSNCGNEVGSGMDVCPKCGSKIAPEASVPQSNDTASMWSAQAAAEQKAAGQTWEVEAPAAPAPEAPVQQPDNTASMWSAQAAAEQKAAGQTWNAEEPAAPASEAPVQQPDASASMWSAQAAAEQSEAAPVWNAGAPAAQQGEAAPAFQPGMAAADPAAQAMPAGNMPFAGMQMPVGQQGVAVQPSWFKRQWKKFLLVTVPAVVVVVAIILAFSPIRAFCIRNFGSAQSYLQYVEANSKNSTAATAANLYESIYNAFAMPEEQTVEAQLSFEVGENLSNMLQSMGGEAMDLSWLQNIVITENATMLKDAYNLQIGLGKDDNTVISADIIMDSANNRILMGFPELSEEYVAMDSTQMESVSGSMTEIANMLPNPKTVRNLLTKYLEIVTENVSQVEKGKNTLTIDGISQEYATLTYKITEADAYRIGQAVLETARDDADLKEAIESVQSLVPSTGTSLYDQFLESVDIMLKSMQQSGEPAANTSEIITIVNYIGGGDAIVGRSISMMGTEVFSYGAVESGDQLAEMIQINLDGNTVALTGSGTMQGDLYNGSHSLDINGGSCVEMELKDYNVKLAESGVANGIIRLQLGDALYDLMPSETASVVRLLNPALEIESTGDQNQGTGSIRLLMNNSVLLGITVEGQRKNPEPINIPDTVVDVQDADAVNAWVQQFSLDKVLAKLKEAGIPDTLISQIESSFQGGIFTDETYGGSSYDDYDYNYDYSYGYDYGYGYANTAKR